MKHIAETHPSLIALFKNNDFHGGVCLDEETQEVVYIELDGPEFKHIIQEYTIDKAKLKEALNFEDDDWLEGMWQGDYDSYEWIDEYKKRLLKELGLE